MFNLDVKTKIKYMNFEGGDGSACLNWLFAFVL